MPRFTMSRAYRLFTALLLLILAAFAATFMPSKQNAVTAAPGYSPGVPAVTPTATMVAEEEHSFRILMGLTDTRSQTWDGSMTVSSGAITRVEPWRFDLADNLSPLGADG
ncbi:MAG: hypothetical protein ACKV2V_28395, partial [Blastocatellia bacterium]